MDHGARGFEEAGLADVVARFLLLYGSQDEFAQLFVGGAAAHFSAEIVFEIRKEAGADLAVGGEADAAARSAEGLGDGGDDADLAYSVGEAIAAGGFAGGVGCERTQGMDGVQTGDDFAQGNDHFRGPEAVFFERHEFDEAHDDVFASGEVGEAFNLVVVEATQEDAVDFDALEAGLLGGADASENGCEAAGDAK
jgi:hypothetical protein